MARSNPGDDMALIGFLLSLVGIVIPVLPIAGIACGVVAMTKGAESKGLAVVLFALAVCVSWGVGIYFIL